MKYGIKKKNLIPSSPGELNNTTNEHVYKEYTFMGKYGLGRLFFSSVFCFIANLHLLQRLHMKLAASLLDPGPSWTRCVSGGEDIFRFSATVSC
jgi:hypothetical protein